MINFIEIKLFNVKKKLFIICLGFIICFNCGCDRPVRLLIKVNNNTPNVIVEYIKQRSNNEFKYVIKSNNSQIYSIMITEKNMGLKPSSFVEYIKITDSAGNIIMNLQGDSLDDSLKYIDKSDSHIGFMLDVN